MKVNNKLLGSCYLVLGLTLLFGYEFYLKARLDDSLLVTLFFGIPILLFILSGLDRLTGLKSKNYYENFSKYGDKYRQIRGIIFIIIGTLTFSCYEFYIKENFEISMVMNFMGFFFSFYPLIYGIKHFVPAKLKEEEKTFSTYEKIEK